MKLLNKLRSQGSSAYYTIAEIFSVYIHYWKRVGGWPVSYSRQMISSRTLVSDLPAILDGWSHVIAACRWPSFSMSDNHIMPQSQTNAFESSRLTDAYTRRQTNYILHVNYISGPGPDMQAMFEKFTIFYPCLRNNIRHAHRCYRTVTGNDTSSVEWHHCWRQWVAFKIISTTPTNTGKVLLGQFAKIHWNRHPCLSFLHYYIQRLQYTKNIHLKHYQRSWAFRFEQQL